MRGLSLTCTMHRNIRMKREKLLIADAWDINHVSVSYSLEETMMIPISC